MSFTGGGGNQFKLLQSFRTDSVKSNIEKEDLIRLLDSQTTQEYSCPTGGRRPLLDSEPTQESFRHPELDSGSESGMTYNREANALPEKSLPCQREGDRLRWRDLQEKSPLQFPPLARGANAAAKAAFTLAEVLITLSIIGVVAAVVMPTLMANYQEKMQKEQVRTIKYKLTQATDKMKSLELIGPYESTEAFIKELKNHYKIVKTCDKENLSKCWPTKTIETPDGEIEVSSLTTGEKLKALAHGTSQTDTMGIVTADGTSMILAYSPVCNSLDPYKTYEWSTQDNKPVTNATTNCISAIFDINGGKKPNRLGKDVRTFNSLFGYKQYSATAMSKAECEKTKTKYGINACHYDQDYYAGAVKKCADIGLHLPDMQTLANIAGAKYGRTDIGVHTLIMRNDYDAGDGTYTGNCEDYFKTHDYGGRLASSDVICVSELPNGVNSSVASINGYFWSSSEVSATIAEGRLIDSTYSTWAPIARDYSLYVPLCVGD